MTIERKVGTAYSIRFTVGAVLYSVGVLVGLRWARSMEGDPWRFAFALLPMLGVLICAWAMMRLVREADEMQQKKMLDALVISSAGTILTCIAYSFMEKVGLPLLNASWVVVVWAVFFIVGTLWTAWRYR